MKREFTDIGFDERSDRRPKKPPRRIGDPDSELRSSRQPRRGRIWAYIIANNDTTSKTIPSIYTFNVEINSKNTPLHRPLWRKQRQKSYFLSNINRGQPATIEKFGPEVPYQWLLLVENNTNLENVSRRSTIIASLSTFAMVSGGFERVGFRRFARKSVEIKGKLSLLPIFTRSLIIE